MNASDLPCSGLMLALLHPDLGPQYSPNLYAWLAVTRNGRLTPRSRLSGLYVDSRGAQWIGYAREGAGFVGQRVANILRDGDAAGIGAWLHTGPMRPVVGFWAKYIRIGRCALDTGHASQLVYSDHRWSRDGNTRHCRWCGAGSQVLTRWVEEDQEHHAWLPQMSATADGDRLEGVPRSDSSLDPNGDEVSRG